MKVRKRKTLINGSVMEEGVCEERRGGGGGQAVGRSISGKKMWRDDSGLVSFIMRL